MNDSKNKKTHNNNTFVYLWLLYTTVRKSTWSWFQTWPFRSSQHTSRDTLSPPLIDRWPGRVPGLPLPPAWAKSIEYTDTVVPYLSSSHPFPPVDHISIAWPGLGASSHPSKTITTKEESSMGQRGTEEEQCNASRALFLLWLTTVTCYEMDRSLIPAISWPSIVHISVDWVAFPSPVSLSVSAGPASVVLYLPLFFFLCPPAAAAAAWDICVILCYVLLLCLCCLSLVLCISMACKPRFRPVELVRTGQGASLQLKQRCGAAYTND